MTVQYEAPHVNGILELSATKQNTLRNQLKTIVAEFVASYEQPIADTFYVVVEHTRKHGEQATFTQLNGDTVEYLLATVDVEVPEEPPVEG